MSSDCKIFNIQRFCTHDGPGIRTVVFLKGCPLRCEWCSNPESQTLKQEILFDGRKCIGCKRCVNVCDNKVPVGRQGVDNSCIMCGRCTEACPTEALELVGKIFSVEEIMEELSKDEQFYKNGGVTVSGGEPLIHSQFVINLAKEIKKSGYHLALETTGYAPWETVYEVFKHFDLILYDIKHMDKDSHKRYTGVSNEMIIDNARKAAKQGFEMIFRVPLIGGVNDSVENIECLAKLCNETGIKSVEFLPYHNLGESKYSLMRKKYEFKGEKPSKEKRKLLAELLEKQGVTVDIG